MGPEKHVARRLPTRLDLRFTDADAKIETAAGISIPDMFAMHGRTYFRDASSGSSRAFLGRGRRARNSSGAYMHPTRAGSARPAVAV